MLMIYLVLTIICTLLDFVGFMIALTQYDSELTAFADCSLLLLSIVFLTIDWYYFAWLMSTRAKFPSYANH